MCIDSSVKEANTLPRRSGGVSELVKVLHLCWIFTKIIFHIYMTSRCTHARLPVEYVDRCGNQAICASATKTHVIWYKKQSTNPVCIIYK